jgi:hypothetical protein
MLDILAAVCALAAAFFWFLSAAKKVPPLIIVPGYENIKNKKHEAFYKAMEYSAKMNKRAAMLSALSALFIGIKTLGG